MAILKKKKKKLKAREEEAPETQEEEEEEEEVAEETEEVEPEPELKPKKPKRPVIEEVAAEEMRVIEAEVERTEPVGKKETQAERDQRVMQQTVRAIVGELVPAMMALQNQSSAGKHPAGRKRFIICNTCKQSGPPDANGKPPCGDEHITMVVYPVKYPEFGKWFQGCIINGIRYLSDNRRDRILIPAACEGQIIKQITDYEENERVTAMGKTAEHNSGEIREGGGGRTKEATQAWR